MKIIFLEIVRNVLNNLCFLDIIENLKIAKILRYLKMLKKLLCIFKNNDY